MKSHGSKPKLCSAIVALDMHVGRFMRIPSIKEKAIRANLLYSWHDNSSSQRPIYQSLHACHRLGGVEARGVLILLADEEAAGVGDSAG